MKVQRVQISIDCSDTERLARFWGEVLGYELQDPKPFSSWAELSREFGTYATEAWAKIVDPDGRGPSILFHSVPEPKAGKNRIHLDVAAPRDLAGDRAQRVAAFVEQIVGLGGHEVRTVQDETDHFAVMQDPEGNEFCVGAGEH